MVLEAVINFSTFFHPSGFASCCSADHGVFGSSFSPTIAARFLSICDLRPVNCSLAQSRRCKVPILLYASLSNIALRSVPITCIGSFSNVSITASTCFFSASAFALSMVSCWRLVSSNMLACCLAYTCPCWLSASISACCCFSAFCAALFVALVAVMAF